MDAGAAVCGDSLWLFSLDGSIASLPAGPGDLAQGARLYHQFCIACHGENGMGGTGNGASLANVGRDPEHH